MSSEKSPYKELGIKSNICSAERLASKKLERRRNKNENLPSAKEHNRLRKKGKQNFCTHCFYGFIRQRGRRTGYICKECDGTGIRPKRKK